MRCAYCGDEMTERPSPIYAECFECAYVGRRVYVKPSRGSDGLPARCGHVERVDARGLLVRHDCGGLFGWSADELRDATDWQSFQSRVHGWWWRVWLWLKTGVPPWQTRRLK